MEDWLSDWLHICRWAGRAGHGGQGRRLGAARTRREDAGRRQAPVRHGRRRPPGAARARPSARAMLAPWGQARAAWSASRSAPAWASAAAAWCSCCSSWSSAHAAVLAARAGANRTAGAWWHWTGYADLALFDVNGEWLAGAGHTACHARQGNRHIMRDAAAGAGWSIKSPCAARAPDAVRRRPRGRRHRARPGRLPCRVTWVDEREDLFPPEVPDNVTIEAPIRRSAGEHGAGHASFLVMTHSHALDQRLAEAILAPRTDRTGSA
jgi:hypothetical protein